MVAVWWQGPSRFFFGGGGAPGTTAARCAPGTFLLGLILDGLASRYDLRLVDNLAVDA